MKEIINILKKDYDKMCKGELVDTILVAIKNGISIPEGCEKLCDAEKVIEGLKGIERLHADDELRSSILEVINTSII